MAEFTVSMMVTGTVDLVVKADTPEEAFKEAKFQFIWSRKDVSDMKITDYHPFDCSRIPQGKK